jgi:HAD superfamily hydrolase (TIGR01509 family)
MRRELVIFDCDGVLVDSELLSNRVLAQALAEIGLPLSVEETIATFMGHSMATCVAIIEERTGQPVPAHFVADFRDRSFDVFRRELRPVRGIESALDAIDLPHCVASSGPPEKIQLTLSITGLLPRFAGRIFSAVEVARGKPHPDLFLHAAERLGATPSACVVVEDSVRGVEAAVAAGMHVFGYADLTDAAVLAGAGAHVFRSMDELPALLLGAANEVVTPRKKATADTHRSTPIFPR